MRFVYSHLPILGGGLGWACAGGASPCAGPSEAPAAPRTAAPRPPHVGAGHGCLDCWIGFTTFLEWFCSKWEIVFWWMTYNISNQVLLANRLNCKWFSAADFWTKKQGSWGQGLFFCESMQHVNATCTCWPEESAEAKQGWAKRETTPHSCSTPTPKGPLKRSCHHTKTQPYWLLQGHMMLTVAHDAYSVQYWQATCVCFHFISVWFSTFVALNKRSDIGKVRLAGGPHSSSSHHVSLPARGFYFHDM